MGWGATIGRAHCRRERRYPPAMPSIRRPGSPRRPGRSFPRPGRPSQRPGRAGAPRIVVVGDLVLDVVVAPGRPLELGHRRRRARVLRPGRIGGHDRALARPARGADHADRGGRSRSRPVGRWSTPLRADGVTAARRCASPGARTGPHRRPRGARRRAQLRPGPGRGATGSRRPTSSRPGSPGRRPLHLPVYSLLGSPLGEAGRRAIELGRAAGAAVSLDLASIGPLLAEGRAAAHELDRDRSRRTSCSRPAPRPRRSSAAPPLDRLLEFAAIAVVKRGPKGATVLAREGDARSASRSRRRRVAADRHDRAPATPSMPGSWSAGSRRERPGGRCRRRSIARRSPGTAPRPAALCAPTGADHRLAVMRAFRNPSERCATSERCTFSWSRTTRASAGSSSRLFANDRHVVDLATGGQRGDRAGRREPGVRCRRPRRRAARDRRLRRRPATPRDRIRASPS